MSNEKILLTVAEVAKLTGFSEGTLRHWISQGRIPVVRISSRCVRFRRSDIEAWLDKLSVPVRTSTSELSRLRARDSGNHYDRRLKSAA